MENAVFNHFCLLIKFIYTKINSARFVNEAQWPFDFKNQIFCRDALNALQISAVVWDIFNFTNNDNNKRTLR